MNSTPRVLAAVWFAAGAALLLGACGPPEDGTDPSAPGSVLRWKYPRGLDVVYRTTVESTSVATSGETNQKQVQRERRTVREVRDSGDIVLRMATEQVKAESMGPTGISSYDSAVDDAPGDLFGRMLQALVGTSFEVVLTRDGEVKHVEGMERVYERVAKTTASAGAGGRAARRMLRKAYSNEAVARMQRQALVPFPTRALDVGDSWTHEFEHVLPVGGTFAGESRYEIQRFEEHEGRTIAILGMKGELRNSTTSDDKSVNVRSSKVTGEMRFDVDRGLLRYSRQDMELDVVFTAMSRAIPVRVTSKTTIEIVE